MLFTCFCFKTYKALHTRIMPCHVKKNYTENRSAFLDPYEVQRSYVFTLTFVTR